MVRAFGTDQPGVKQSIHIGPVPPRGREEAYIHEQNKLNQQEPPKVWLPVHSCSFNPITISHLVTTKRRRYPLSRQVLSPRTTTLSYTDFRERKASLLL